MSTHEDRLRKLENAMTTLAELAAKADTRMDRTDERMTNLENLVTRLAQVTTKGFEETNTKINALADSHIHLLDSFERLVKAQEKIEEMTRQNSQDIAILINSQMETGQIIQRHSENINRLAETVRQLVEHRNWRDQ